MGLLRRFGVLAVIATAVMVGGPMSSTLAGAHPACPIGHHFANGSCATNTISYCKAQREANCFVPRPHMMCHYGRCPHTGGSSTGPTA